MSRTRSPWNGSRPGDGAPTGAGPDRVMLRRPDRWVVTENAGRVGRSKLPGGQPKRRARIDCAVPGLARTSPRAWKCWIRRGIRRHWRSARWGSGTPTRVEHLFDRVVGDPGVDIGAKCRPVEEKRRILGPLG